MIISFCEHLCFRSYCEKLLTCLEKKKDDSMKFSSSLKLNHNFQRLYHTKGVADGNIVLYARRNRTESNRVGITVSKKLGKAHIRNRTRRRLREVYRLNEEIFQPGWDIVMVARTKAVDASFDSLIKSVLTLAGKAGILQDSDV